MMLAELFKSFNHFIHPATADVTKPLLDPDELNTLRIKASEAAQENITKMKSAQPLIGVQESAKTGNGFDFESLRQYQHTDSLRSINWRVFARTGSLHVNTFNEERQHGMHIVMDRRQRMRFATQGQLKVTQAAMVCSYYAMLAEYSHISVSSTVLDSPTQWQEKKTGSQHTQQAINDFIAACPPVHQEQQASSISDVLKASLLFTSPGDEVILASDFQDLLESDKASLYQLGKQCSVTAYHILDPAEITLPAEQTYRLRDFRDSEYIDINALPSDTLAKHNALLQSKVSRIQKYLQEAGVDYHQLLNTDLFPKQ